nr:immunoglobulin heavy chain junction region [Mus musculus]MBK4187216.1 immunoglobulin heavy chain junction region [Mus musculus]MBK4187218.1 immunoglobulin heavy chain junction region [Mus musculus]
CARGIGYSSDYPLYFDFW